MISWTWLIFIFVVGLLLYNIGRDKGSSGSYSFDIETPFYLILLGAFILIWGGFFWW